METAAEADLGLQPQNVVLTDGTPVLVRPIQPDDKALLQDGIRLLSDRTRYRRFGMAVKELSEAELKYLTEIDHQSHVAFLAVEFVDGRERAVGEARYVRFDNDPEGAEVALSVLDSHQKRGLGKSLLSRLAQAAKSNGVNRFVAYVHWDNAPVLKLIREFGAGVRFLGSGMVRVAGPVPELSADGPTTGW